MPPGGSEFGFRPVRAFSGAQTKMPEFPPDLRCRHWATSSKFVTGCFVRVTPTGVPVQWATPSFQVQVSGSQLTFVKSSSPSARHPGPVPSMKALGSRGRLVGDPPRPRPASGLRQGPGHGSTTMEHSLSEPPDSGCSMNQPGQDLRRLLYLEGAAQTRVSHASRASRGHGSLTLVTETIGRPGMCRSETRLAARLASPRRAGIGAGSISGSSSTRTSREDRWARSRRSAPVGSGVPCRASLTSEGEIARQTGTSFAWKGWLDATSP